MKLSEKEKELLRQVPEHRRAEFIERLTDRIERLRAARDKAIKAALALPREQ